MYIWIDLGTQYLYSNEENDLPDYGILFYADL